MLFSQYRCNVHQCFRLINCKGFTVVANAWLGDQSALSRVLEWSTTTKSGRALRPLLTEHGHATNARRHFRHFCQQSCPSCRARSVGECYLHPGGLQNNVGYIQLLKLIVQYSDSHPDDLKPDTAVKHVKEDPSLKDKLRDWHGTRNLIERSEIWVSPTLDPLQPLNHHATTEILWSPKTRMKIQGCTSAPLNDYVPCEPGLVQSPYRQEHYNKRSRTPIMEGPLIGSAIICGEITNFFLILTIGNILLYRTKFWDRKD